MLACDEKLMMVCCNGAQRVRSANCFYHHHIRKDSVIYVNVQRLQDSFTNVSCLAYVKLQCILAIPTSCLMLIVNLVMCSLINASQLRMTLTGCQYDTCLSDMLNRSQLTAVSGKGQGYFKLLVQAFVSGLTTQF